MDKDSILDLLYFLARVIKYISYAEEYIDSDTFGLGRTFKEIIKDKDQPEIYNETMKYIRFLEEKL